jgi:hypothetical protein
MARALRLSDAESEPSDSDDRGFTGADGDMLTGYVASHWA